MYYILRSKTFPPNFQETKKHKVETLVATQIVMIFLWRMLYFSVRRIAHWKANVTVIHSIFTSVVKIFLLVCYCYFFLPDTTIVACCALTFVWCFFERSNSKTVSVRLITMLTYKTYWVVGWSFSTSILLVQVYFTWTDRPVEPTLVGKKGTDNGEPQK